MPDLALGIIGLLLFFFTLFLFGRIVVSVLLSMDPHLRPRGIWVVLVEAIYTVTDPPVKALGKVIPPLSLGRIQLDLGFLILLIASSLLWPVLLYR